MKIDGLNIVTTEIRQSRPGGKRYSARVQALYVIDESGRRKVTHQFGDAWGRTRNDAIQAMKHVVGIWLAAQAPKQKPGEATAGSDASDGDAGQ